MLHKQLPLFSNPIFLYPQVSIVNSRQQRNMFTFRDADPNQLVVVILLSLRSLNLALQRSTGFPFRGLVVPHEAVLFLISRL